MRQGSEIRDRGSVEIPAALQLVPRSNATAPGAICPGCAGPSWEGGYCYLCRDAPVGYAIDEFGERKKLPSTRQRLADVALMLGVWALVIYIAVKLAPWFVELAEIWKGLLSLGGN